MSFRELYTSCSYVKKTRAREAVSSANATDKSVAAGNEVYIFRSYILPGERRAGLDGCHSNGSSISSCYFKEICH